MVGGPADGPPRRAVRRRHVPAVDGGRPRGRAVRHLATGADAAGVAPGRYQILAAINAVHTSARDVRDTDWSQVVALYDVLLRLTPSPVVELNRAVAVAMRDGPAAGLDLIDRVAAAPELRDYHPLPAARADLLARLGRPAEAAQAYRAALELVGNEPERIYLTRRLAALRT